MLAYGKLDQSEIHKVNQMNALGEKEWLQEFFSPSKPQSFVYHCKDQEEIVGCEGYLGYPLFHRGTLCQTHRSERTLLNPSHRGKGIFEALVIECDREANTQQSHMSWGATAALKPFVRAGFDPFTGFRNYLFFSAQTKFMNRIKNLVYSIGVLNPLRLYRVYKNRNLEEIKKTVAWLSLLRPFKASANEVMISNYDDAVVYEMLTRFSETNQDYILYPQKELFAWLAGKNLEYDRHLFFKGGQAVGYAACRVQPETKILHVVDFFCTDSKWVVGAMNALISFHASAKMNGVFLALNLQNETHAGWIREFRNARAWILSNIGSFVIKSLPAAQKKIQIKELLLTDLWLEL